MHTKDRLRFEVETVVQAEAEASASRDLFLSPDWIRQVVDHVETAKKADPHFSGLVSDLSLTVSYVIRNIPEWLGHWYGPGGEARLSIHLDKGKVRKIEVGGQHNGDKAQITVTIDYKVAKRLIAGEISPARTILNQSLKAKPAKGFRQWTKIATTSVLTVSKVLRTARKVPTIFEPCEKII